MLIIEAALLDVISEESPARVGSAAPVPIDEARDKALLHCAGLEAGDGSIIEGWSSLQGNDTLIAVFKVDAATGQRTQIASVAPPAGFKLDDFTFWQSGTALLVGMVAHEAISSPTRRNIYARAAVPGVLVAYGPGTPRGALIDLALLQGLDPVPAPTPAEPIDYARIGVLVQGQVDRLISLFGGNSVRSGLQEKMEDALVRLMDKDATPPDPRSVRYLDLLAAFVRDRAYEGAMAAIHPQEPEA